MAVSGYNWGKNKDETIKDFLRTLRENPGANVVLLVDSDAPYDGRLLENLRQGPHGKSCSQARLAYAHSLDGAGHGRAGSWPMAQH